MKSWLFREPETNKCGGLKFDHLGNLDAMKIRITNFKN
jgi:hypothetical protein